MTIPGRTGANRQALLAACCAALLSIPGSLSLAAEQGDLEVASPMVAEVKLPPMFGSISPRPGTALQKEFTEMRRQVCNKTRVDRVKVSRTTDKKGRAVLKVEPTILYRRDFRLKLEVVAGSETLLTHEAQFGVPRQLPPVPGVLSLFQPFSISPAAELAIEEAKWKAAFSEDSAPVVRLTLTFKE